MPSFDKTPIEPFDILRENLSPFLDFESLQRLQEALREKGATTPEEVLEVLNGLAGAVIPPTNLQAVSQEVARLLQGKNVIS